MEAMIGTVVAGVIFLVLPLIFAATAFSGGFEEDDKSSESVDKAKLGKGVGKSIVGQISSIKSQGEKDLKKGQGKN